MSDKVCVISFSHNLLKCKLNYLDMARHDVIYLTLLYMIMCELHHLVMTDNMRVTPLRHDLLRCKLTHLVMSDKM